jgi:hypothetical protein
MRLQKVRNPTHPRVEEGYRSVRPCGKGRETKEEMEVGRGGEIPVDTNCDGLGEGGGGVWLLGSGIGDVDGTRKRPFGVMTRQNLGGNLREGQFRTKSARCGCLR